MTRAGNEVILHPYVPGITDAISYKEKTINASGKTIIVDMHPSSEMAKIAMGIDCNGLVQTSHSYENNNYKATDSRTIVPVMY
jgi:hypothetical protein